MRIQLFGNWLWLKKWILFILLPFWINADISWQADLKKPFKFTIQLHPEEVNMGDALHLDIEYQYPSTYDINREDLIDQLIWSANPFDQQWALIDSEISALSLEENMQGGHLKLTLVALMAGHLELSFLTIIFPSEEKEVAPVEIISPIFSFNVPLPPPQASLGFAPLVPLEPQFPLEMSLENRQNIIGNPQELEKIKTWIRHDLETRSFPWITLAILLALCGGGWVIFLLRDRLPERNTQIGIPPLSARQKIGQKLEALKHRPFNSVEVSIYYVELSSILHDAIEVRSGLKAHTFTTFELAKKIKIQSSIPAEQVNKAISLLKEMDQVKFANQKPSRAEAEQCFERTFQLISELNRDEIIKN